MEKHLLVAHNVTEDNWNELQNWRNKNTTDYYDITEIFEERMGPIKRIRSCKKCGYIFPQSNLIIMLKHLIETHNCIPDIPRDQLPKGLLELNPVVDASTFQKPSTSSNSHSSQPKPAGPGSKVWRPWDKEDP